MRNLIYFFSALRAGESLSNPATWKQRQLRLNALLPIVYFLSKLLPVELSTDEVDAVATGLALISGALVNGYFTLATSDKIGLGGARGES